MQKTIAHAPDGTTVQPCEKCGALALPVKRFPWELLSCDSAWRCGVCLRRFVLRYDDIDPLNYS